MSLQPLGDKMPTSCNQCKWFNEGGHSCEKGYYSEFVKDSYVIPKWCPGGKLG